MRGLFEVKVKLGGETHTMSLLSYYILYAVSDGPKNGYDILKKIKEISNNVWTPPKSTVYPLLKKMVQMGLLEMDSDGRYKITERGRELLRMSQSEYQRLQQKLQVAQRMLNEIMASTQSTQQGQG